jgi:hypothetical protein
LSVISLSLNSLIAAAGVSFLAREISAYTEGMLWLAVAIFVVLGLALIFVLRGGEKSLASESGGSSRLKGLLDRRKPQ